MDEHGLYSICCSHDSVKLVTSFHPPLQIRLSKMKQTWVSSPPAPSLKQSKDCSNAYRNHTEDMTSSSISVVVCCAKAACSSLNRLSGAGGSLSELALIRRSWRAFVRSCMSSVLDWKIPGGSSAGWLYSSNELSSSSLPARREMLVKLSSLLKRRLCVP